MRLRSLVIALFVSLFTAGAAVAQSSKGILAGTVRDATAAVVPNATVTVTSQDTSEARKTTTTATGSFRVEAINPGLYRIVVEMAGFHNTEVKDLRVLPSVVTTFDPILNVGEVGETVSVEANTNAINTDNGHLSGTIETKELSLLPIFSLSPFELVATLPGVQMMNPSLNLQGVGGNYEQLSVNGARPRSNNYMLDGQDINDVGIGGQSFNPQIPDMYQSNTALLNSSSAEYGRSGGAVVNLITKSGTNQYHGSVWELYSGSGLNANDGVSRQFDAPKARYDEHQFGFTAGGPLWRDKLFAFGGTQFSRFYGKSTSGQIVLPDAAGYAQLTAIGGPEVAIIQGLLNNGSYLNTFAVGGPSRTSNVSAAGGCPTAVCAVTTAFFQRPPVDQQEPDTQWMYRIDFIPRSADTFTFRYMHDRSNFTPDLGLNTSGLPGFDGEVGGPSELAQGTWTHVFTSNLLNEFRASEVRLDSEFLPTPETLANPLAKMYNVTLNDSNFQTLGVSQNIPQGRAQQLYQFQDTVGWTKGRHSLRLGVDVGRDHETDLIAQNALGGLTIQAGGGLSALDNFLQNRLGTSGSATKTFGPTRVDPHMWKLAWFAQDDIKLSPDLTINLGIRYDYVTVPDNVLPYPAVDPNNPFAPINTVVKVQADKNNFAPRIGFAFVPHYGFLNDGKTVIHGGFGIFYDTDFTNILVNSAQSSPNAPTGTNTSTATGGLTNATGQLSLITPVLDGLASSVESVASNLVNPLTYQYNFGVERELPAQVKMTVNYVGARGQKLFSNRQLNYFGGFNEPRLNPNRNAINIRDNRADSNYNSLQIEGARSFGHGLFFRASYTFGKLLDDASEVFATFASPTSYSANLAGNGLYQDYGHSAFDRQHVASFAYAWSPAGFHSNNFAANLLLSAFTRNYTISGTTQFSSGSYQSFSLLGLDTNGDGSAANDRPIVGNRSLPINTVGIDGVYLGATPGVYYDLAANNLNNALNPVTASQVHFLIPYGAQYQNQEVGRNSFENPGQSFWNLALQKAIPVGFKHFEGSQFVLRAEGQNIGNHNNVGPLDSSLLDVGTAAFLDKSAAREPTFQNFRLWAKFVF